MLAVRRTRCCSSSRSSSSGWSRCSLPTVTTADSEIITVVEALPGLFGWFWEISYDLLVVWPLVLLIATVVARHRLFLLRDQVIATVLAFAGSLFVAGELVGAGRRVHRVGSSARLPGSSSGARDRRHRDHRAPPRDDRSDGWADG